MGKNDRKYNLHRVIYNDEPIEGITMDSHLGYISSTFITRIKEKYDIDLTENEYWAICGNYKFKHLYELNAGKFVASMQIKGQTVYVIRSKDTHSLNTCFIPPKYPIPVILESRENYDREQFNRDINDIRLMINKVINWLDEHNDDRRTLFVDQPLTIPRGVICLGINHRNGFLEKKKTNIDAEIIRYLIGKAKREKENGDV